MFGTRNSKHSRFYIFRSASIESNRQGAHLRECTRGIGAEADRFGRVWLRRTTEEKRALL